MKSNILRLAKFGVVGASGVVVNVLVFELFLWLLGDRGGQPERVFVSNAAGVAVSIFTNFVLNDRWTWSDRAKGEGRAWLTRMGKYYAAASVAALVQLTVTQVSLWAVFGAIGLNVWGHEMGPTLALLSGIGCGMVINFLASHLWAFKDA